MSSEQNTPNVNPDKAALKKASREAKKAEKAARVQKAKTEVKVQPAKKVEENANNDNNNNNNDNAKKPAVKAIRLKAEYVNKTPKGEKKDLTEPMAEAYNPPAVEAAWYDWWEKEGYFQPDLSDPNKEKFIIVIPPPNVTGSLHIGHALTNAIEDSLTRWHRMSGRVALWVPGTDHAGIATQSVVEKRLAKERGVTRHDLGREAFVGEVMKWKDEYRDRITTQLRRLGSSCDWSREAFTMDNNFSRAVLEAFCQLYDRGLIYRENRMVNWSCALQSTISDLEVDSIELDGKKKLRVPGYDKPIDFGELILFAYKVDGEEDKEIVVATTRIETMLGDTAVAVHPDDPRYTSFHGKYLKHPFLDRKIPIICDGELVEMGFGTGAVKVTPSHDPNDYQCGKRNNLEFINILNDNGTLNDNCGKFSGKRRYDVRYELLKELEQLNLLRGRENNKMVLSKCSRSGDIIEPVLKPQWWVNCDELAKNALDAVNSKEITIIPDRPHEGTWRHYLSNIQPWCISRQLWWGHRVPAYRVSIGGNVLPDDQGWVVGRSIEEAKQRAIEKFKDVNPDEITLSQDEDVLDTWFSSGIFPIGVFGWPDNTADLQAFYPTSLLETGYDILFFWVMRMVMMCHALTGILPFSKVYLHTLVRDAQGRKMSKSLGNVIDPIDVIEGITLEDLHNSLLNGNLSASEIETAKKNQKKDFPNGISECGTDAIRFALCDFTLAGRDINMNINQVVVYRNFCNKLWNATIFLLRNIGADYKPPSSFSLSPQSGIAERWIVSRLHQAARTVDEGWKSFEFSGCTRSIFNFILNEFCSVFLELTKPTMALPPQEAEAKQTSVKDTLYYCFEFALRLLHPFMPFITEELWQRLPRREGDAASIMIAQYPLPDPSLIDIKSEEVMTFSDEVVHRLRSIRTSYGLPPKLSAEISFWTANEESYSLISSISSYITTLTNTKLVTILRQSDQTPAQTAVIIINDSLRIYLSIAGVNIEKEVAKLQQLLKKSNDSIAQLEKLMAGSLYDNTPTEKKQKDKERIIELNKEILSIKDAINGLQTSSN